MAAHTPIPQRPPHRWRQFALTLLKWLGAHSAKPHRDLAVFTMVYNEQTMLPLWARYYLQQVGPGNVYVLDHGSDSLPPLPGCVIVPLRRLDLDEIQRTQQVQCFQHKLLQHYHAVLFTDCDEFMVARPPLYASLNDYVRKTLPTTVQCVGVDVVQHAPDLPAVNWKKPILAQRPYGAIRPWSCKSLLSTVPLTWQPGFHTCVQPSNLDTNLWLFHLKYADQTHLLERLTLTRTLNWSARAISLGHGHSHRAPDQAMRNFLADLQKTRTETDLDTLCLKEAVLSGHDSALHRIPAAFLQVL